LNSNACYASVSKVPDGQQGLQAVVCQRPDVVFLDLGLPDRDGVEVLKRLREDEHDKVRARDAGADSDGERR